MNADFKQQLDMANKYIFVRDYDKASRILNQLAKQDPSFMLVQLRRIELAAKLKQLVQISDEFSRLTSDGLWLELCRVIVGLHGETLDPDEAMVRMQQVLKNHGDHAVAYYAIGYSLELRGNVERAMFNYRKSIETDQDWYPAYFGLSQLSYQQGDQRSGDQYFAQFEQAAPYNVYGNFDTHRSISAEFLEREQFKEAEVAIAALSEWWVENKGRCPVEIQIFEHFSIARISHQAGDHKKAKNRHEMGLGLAENLLTLTTVSEGVIYFVARNLEEFNEFDLAIQFYKKALRLAGNNPQVVQRIGGQFISLGEYQLALDLFSDAYQIYPDNPEIRFCILVSKLKLSGVNVEEYLIGKERLKQLTSLNADKVEILALLHSLMAKFPEDPDVHQQMADIYLRMGNVERAGRNYERMFELDQQSMQSGLRYVGFHLSHGDAEKAVALLMQLESKPHATPNDRTEIQWLKSSYYFRSSQFALAVESSKKALAMDPWNVSYLVVLINSLKQMAQVDDGLKRPEAILEKLSRLEEQGLEWKTFDEHTQTFLRESCFELAYHRAKLRLLYADRMEFRLSELVKCSLHYDIKAATSDLLRLINTNFDHPAVYFSLGRLYKELWQLETAAMWFDQCLVQISIEQRLRAACYAELADCMVWAGRDLKTALEFAKLATELYPDTAAEVQSTLGHIYLKLGQVKSASEALGQASHDASDRRFLLGLIEYRNGDRPRANEIWKPLLTTKAESMRLHHIKQEILKYYFEGTPYFRAN